MSKIIIYNYNTSQSILNFFDVFNVHPDDEYKNLSIESLPRVIGSNENFERLEESEAKWLIDKYIAKGFYLGESLNITRYYNSKVYPENN